MIVWTSSAGADVRTRRPLPGRNSLTGQASGNIEEHSSVAWSHATSQMDQLSGLCVLFSHILEGELLGLKERVLIVEGCVIEEFARGHAQGVGDSFDHVGGRILAPLFDVAEVALGHSRLVCEGLQGEVSVCAQTADGESYVVGESPLRHFVTPDFEGCPDGEAWDRTFCSV